MTRPSMNHVLVSLLIVLAGWLAAQALTQLDRDLRILYTEYTLAAADLGHISGDLIRYRSTILRALEAPTAPEADRILASLPVQRDRVLQAIERPAAAAALQALRTSVAAYFADADETIRLIRRRWAAPRPKEAAAWQAQAERHASAQAGVTLIRVSVALDQVLDVVATVAGAMYEDGARTTRRSSLLLVGGSLVLIALVWFAPRVPRPVRPLSRETSSSAGDGVPAAVTPRSDDRCADSSTRATEESRYHKAPRVTGDPGA